jgi:hypothetical protein
VSVGVDQPLRALERANAVRRAVRDLRDRVEAGELAVTDVLLGQVPGELASAAQVIRVEHVLRSGWSIGPSIAARVCARAGVNAAGRLGDLPPGRRRELLEALLDVRPGLAEMGARDA